MVLADQGEPWRVFGGSFLAAAKGFPFGGGQWLPLVEKKVRKP
jgi:hypothetical protein